MAPLGAGSSITVTLPPGEHVVTCTVTDSDGSTGRDQVGVVSLSPLATILHPGDGETRPGTAVPFSGAGRDFEDGALPATSLVWTSSRDGVLGTGASFSRALSPGVHVVTLTATDLDGNTGVDTVTLMITEP